MKTSEIFDDNNAKGKKLLWRQIKKLGKQNKHESDNTKQFRVVQSVKAGHIRGGHAFH